MTGILSQRTVDLGCFYSFRLLPFLKVKILTLRTILGHHCRGQWRIQFLLHSCIYFYTVEGQVEFLNFILFLVLLLLTLYLRLVFLSTPEFIIGSVKSHAISRPLLMRLHWAITGVDLWRALLITGCLNWSLSLTFLIIIHYISNITNLKLR